jgi:hypothetical protein
MNIPVSKKISKLVILQTNGYELRFYLVLSKNYYFFNARVEFSVNHDCLQQVCIKSEKFKISLDDLRHLLNYLRSHMQSLQSDENHESYSFSDYNLAYRMQALCGFASSDPKESYFSIISMVNIGRPNPSGDSVYIGGESTISFERVEEFITSLEELIAIAEQTRTT